jgi:hypothetical protein
MSKMHTLDSLTRDELSRARDKAEKARDWGTVTDIAMMLQLIDRHPKEQLSWLVENDNQTVQAAARRVVTAVCY